MAQPKVPPTDRVSASYKKLSSMSPDLHSAAKELTKTVEELSDALDPLSLRVAAWATIASGREHENSNYWSRSVGYAWVDGDWRIALKQESGNDDADVHDETIWSFGKAPRWMIIESVAKLPDLFETLITRVADMTVKLRVRNEQAKELLAAVNATAAELESSKDEK